MNVNRIFFNLNAKKDEIFQKSKKVVFNGKPTDFFYSKDLFSIYISLFGPISFADFFSSLSKLPNYCVFPAPILKNSLVCLTSNINKDLAYKIINESSLKRPNHEELNENGNKKIKVNAKLASNSYKHLPNLVEEDKNINNSNKVKINQSSVISNNSNNKKKGNIQIQQPSNQQSKISQKDQNLKTKKNNQPIAATNQPQKNTPSPVSNMKPTSNEGSMTQYKPKINIKDSIYDNLSSSDSEMNYTSSNFKSPYAPASEKKKNDFESTKQVIVDAFDNCPVIPLTSFNQAICKKKKMMFDYKNLECNIPFHKHNKLSKFLMCCKEIVALKSFKQVYAFTTTNYILELNKRRASAYVISKSDKNFNYYLELLFCTLFPVPVQIPLEDFIDVFNSVFNLKINEIVDDLKAFLLKIQSPNAYLTNKSGESFFINVRFFHDCSYKEWQPNTLFTKLTNIEKKVMLMNQPIISAINLDEPAACTSIFKSYISQNPSSIKDINRQLCIAELNIPKCVQELSNDNLHKDLIYSPIWKYLRQNINFDDAPTFFYAQC